jgi:hypothetical protein
MTLTTVCIEELTSDIQSMNIQLQLEHQTVRVECWEYHGTSQRDYSQNFCC